MIGIFIIEYLKRNNIALKDFAEKLGFEEKTVRRWIIQRQVPSKFNASCILCLLLGEIQSDKKKEEFEEMFWWTWRTEFDLKLIRKRTKRRRNKQIKQGLNDDSLLDR